MNFSQLSDAQLRAEYAKANEEYIRALRTTPRDQKFMDPYKSAKQHLDAVIAELKKRTAPTDPYNL